MRTLDATGKTIDEAIFNGLKELGISIDEVEIDIVQHESKGVLGFGAKPAIVRLIEREPEEIVVPAYLSERPRAERSDRPRRNDRPRRDSRDSRPPRTERTAEQRTESAAMRPAEPRPESAERAARPPRQPRQPREERAEAREAKPSIDYSAEAAENEPSAAFLKGLLERMGVEGSVLANVSDDGVRLRIDSNSMGILIGHRGETLDAIQYITSLKLNRSRKENGYTRVTIDTEDYRDKREETLSRLARKVASQVRTSGRPRALEPMNPYERRILHSTLQNNPYVTTYSEGEEPNRRVIVAPKGAAPREK